MKKIVVQESKNSSWLMHMTGRDEKKHLSTCLVTKSSNRPPGNGIKALVPTAPCQSKQNESFLISPIYRV